MKTNPSFLPPPRDIKPEKSGFIFPGPTDRVTVNGMTGSGKSTFALWLFAESADFDKRPWIILDFKGETIVQEALRQGIFKTWSISDELPKDAGVYVVDHDASSGQAIVSTFLWKIYKRGKTGLFLDEATMVPELRGEGNSGGPFQSILSQGRTKGIPTYVLAQRPVHVNNMVFTENNYYSAFKLASKDDLKKVASFIPEESFGYERVWGKNAVRLPPFWSRWYDRQTDKSYILRPVPDANEILNILFERVDAMKKKKDL